MKAGRDFCQPFAQSKQSSDLGQVAQDLVLSSFKYLHRWRWRWKIFNSV